jgi:peptide/nickel transport system ATP-binding protein
MPDLLNVNDLQVEFHVTEGIVHAVNGVSFRVPAGKTVALVGESGSGKSVVSQTIMGILPKPAKVTGGEVIFHDPRDGSVTDLLTLDQDGEKMRSISGGRISIIFQEPMT